MLRHCEQREAIQRAVLDCRVAALLAMTILMLFYEDRMSESAMSKRSVA